MSDTTSTPTNLLRSLRLNAHDTEWRTPLTMLSAAFALGCMVLAASAFARDAISDAVNGMVVGTLAVGVAVILHRPALPALETVPAATAPPIRWRGVNLGALSLILLSVINGHNLTGVHYTLQVVLLILGVLLVVRGMTGGWVWPPVERHEWLALAAMLVFGLQSLLPARSLACGKRPTRLFCCPSTMSPRSLGCTPICKRAQSAYSARR
jgi:hypothetical protein